MTQNPYAPFRLWLGLPDDSTPRLWIFILPYGYSRQMIDGIIVPDIRYAADRGHRFFIPLRDSSRYHPMIEAFRCDPRIIMALMVEQQGDLDRLVPGITGLYITPVESLHTDDQSLGLLGTRPDSWGMDYGPVADMIRLVIAHGQIGPDAQPCRGEWLSSIVADCATAIVPCCVPDAGAGEWVEVTHPEIYDWSDTPYDRHTLDGRLFVRSGAAWNPRCDWPRELPEGWTNG